MTIVNRRTYIPKRGHVDEAITMLKAEETDLVKRVYRSYYGQVNVVVMEVDSPVWSKWKGGGLSGFKRTMQRHLCPAGSRSPSMAEPMRCGFWHRRGGIADC